MKYYSFVVKNVIFEPANDGEKSRAAKLSEMWANQFIDIRVESSGDESADLKKAEEAAIDEITYISGMCVLEATFNTDVDDTDYEDEGEDEDEDEDEDEHEDEDEDLIEAVPGIPPRPIVIVDPSKKPKK